jgi:hypothetical protein
VQKQFNLGFGLLPFTLVLVHAALVAGCSGSDAAPPTLDEVSGGSSNNSSNNQGVAGSSNGSTPIDTTLACDEGKVEDCRTPIAARDGYYLCGQGHRSCRSNAWSECATHETSAGEDQWTPITVGCDAPAERCDHEGEARDCVQNMPPAAPGQNNCYHGKQTCTDRAWSTCIQNPS